MRVIAALIAAAALIMPALAQDTPKPAADKPAAKTAEKKPAKAKSD